MSDSPRVAVVGGGLAGLAAALALAQCGVAVELFEARRNLGGRAGSFRDPATGETIDHCQHVAMGCCTNFLDFCRETGADRLLRRIRTLHFFGPDGRRCDFTGSSWLPAPFHLAGGLWRLDYLSLAERLSIGRALAALAAERTIKSETIGQWLRRHRQSPPQIERFWSVVLTSALSESVDRASVAAARKVFVDGFMAARSAYEVYVPSVPLAKLYDDCVARRLESLGVTIHRGAAVRGLVGDARCVSEVALASGESRGFDDYVLAVPWRRAYGLLDPAIQAVLPRLALVAELAAAPITAVHLWLDRPITNIGHAVFVGRLSQWMFARDADSGYYQVVISAAFDLRDELREAIVARVLADLRAVFPEAVRAVVRQSRVVTDASAVFSPTAEAEALRPAQTTAIENLFLAGDWTATRWPATMESAVRSGRLAAAAVCRRHGLSSVALTGDLPRGWFMRWFGE